MCPRPRIRRDSRNAIFGCCHPGTLSCCSNPEAGREKPFPWPTLAPHQACCPQVLLSPCSPRSPDPGDPLLGPPVFGLPLFSPSRAPHQGPPHIPAACIPAPVAPCHPCQSCCHPTLFGEQCWESPLTPPCLSSDGALSPVHHSASCQPHLGGVPENPVGDTCLWARATWGHTGVSSHAGCQAV